MITNILNNVECQQISMGKPFCTYSCRSISQLGIFKSIIEGRLVACYCTWWISLTPNFQATILDYWMSYSLHQPPNSFIRNQNKSSSQRGYLPLDTRAVQFGDDSNVWENVKVGSGHHLLCWEPMWGCWLESMGCPFNASIALTTIILILIRFECFFH